MHSKVSYSKILYNIVPWNYIFNKESAKCKKKLSPTYIDLKQHNMKPFTYFDMKNNCCDLFVCFLKCVCLYLKGNA